MRTMLRSGFMLLALSGLSACDFSPSEPISLLLEFEPQHVLLEDGSCELRYEARAFGTGRAEWRGVTIRAGTDVLRQYSAEEAVQFWGEEEIRAGETQHSDPYVLDPQQEGVTVEVFYLIARDTRSTTLLGECASD